jgi:sulfite reductase (NADPH) hemoprotein beta-component
VDVFANDVGLIAIIENNVLTGFNISAGGGLGATHGNADTYPRLGTVLGYVEKENALKVVYEIATVQRDYGNRSDRKLSRLKYTIDRLGIDIFKAEVEKRSGVAFEKAKPAAFTTRSDDYGWQKNHEGQWFYTAFVENGRVLDDEKVQFKTAFLEIAKSRKAHFVFTANQNIIVAGVANKDKKAVDEILTRTGVIQNTESASNVRKQSMACVALNTCPLALAEGQRYLPQLITKIEKVMAAHHLADENIIIRMTGCPNGCARPYMAEVGFVGTGYGRYNMHLGANPQGTRLNRLYKENLNEDEILHELDGLLKLYAQKRKKKEAFGDFVLREGIFSESGGDI